MNLHWKRDADGVVTVTGTTTDGREFDVADFWLQPMIDALGVSREVAAQYQEQHAMLLVTTHNRIFTPHACAPKSEATEWVCPIGMPECQADCGAYGCGN